MRQWWPLILASVVVALAACTSSPFPESSTTSLTATSVSTTSSVASTTAPTVVLTAAELEDAELAAMAFFERFYEGWPDLEDRFSEFADDAVFYDPTFGDYWIGPQEIIAGWAMMPSAFPDLEAATKSLFLADGDAVFAVDWINFWPGVKPSDVPWPAGLEVFRFKDGQVAGEDLWYTAATLEGQMRNCGGCTTEIQSAVDRYVAAWSSGDADQIAALYSADATFADTMFGITATNPETIAGALGERFGLGETTIAVQGIYGITLGTPLVGPETAASPGDVIGVGLHFLWTADDAAVGPVESLALLYFGTVEDGHYSADSQNLIMREEVFHVPGTLTAPTS